MSNRKPILPLVFPRLNIPTSFGNELSYYEEIRSLVDAVNQTILLIDERTQDINSYTDEQISNLRNELNQNVEMLTLRIDNQGELLTELIGITATQLETSLKLYVDNAINQVNLRITNEVIQLNARITFEHSWMVDYINNSIIDLQVVNPATGETVGIQEVLNYIIDAQKTDALTAGEYDALELTASAYDAKELTAYQYDFNGKSLLP